MTGGGGSAVPGSPHEGLGRGVYVHVPFCLVRCGYCDFNAYAGMDHLAGPYRSASTESSGVVRMTSPRKAV